MLTYESALGIIQKSCQSLKESGLVEDPIVVQDGTVFLGSGSPLDSLAFVVFITDLEERLNREEQKEDLFLVLKDIHEFNADNSSLTAGVLAKYLVNLTGGKV